MSSGELSEYLGGRWTVDIGQVCVRREALVFLAVRLAH